MKIALNIEYFRPKRGGGESYAANLARGLIERGHEVHVFASHWESDIPGITYHRVLSSKALGPFRELAFAVSSAMALRGGEFDIIQGFGKSTYMDVYRPGGGVHRVWMEQDLESVDSPAARRWMGVKRRFSIRQAINLRIERRQYESGRVKRIIAPSAMVKKHILQHYRVDESRIEIIPNGVDLRKFNPANRDRFRREVRGSLNIGDELVLLFVANNFRLKGLGCLICLAGELVKRVGARAFKVLVVGRGKREPYLRLAGKVGCERNLIFVGGSQAVERFYAAADIFVHPTFYDPFGNVCLEALAAGLPVITTRFVGVAEFMTNGREGFIVDSPRDTARMLECVLRLLDTRFREKASRAARTLAENYPLSRNCDEVLKVYEEVVREKQGGE